MRVDVLVDVREDAADAWVSHIESIVGGHLKADVDSGFFGSKPFSRANAFLESHGRGTIDWRVDRNTPV